jgi:hypothetical protein
LILLSTGNFLAPSSLPNERRVRWILVLFAGTLAAAGAWTLTAELARPPRTGFPVNENYQGAAEYRPQTERAAYLGMVRGDLWAESFFSFADSIFAQSGRDFGAISTLNEALPAAERALAYAPYQSEVWLLLADMAEKYELPNPKSGDALKMSYYTAPYKTSLTPLRLSVATRADTLSDLDLKQFVDRDLRMILAGQPELRPAIVAAYAKASEQGRHLIENVAQEVDISFLDSLRKSAP